MADVDNRLDREDGIRTMDELAKVEDYEGWSREDVVFYLVAYARKKNKELASLREMAEKAEAERDALKVKYERLEAIAEDVNDWLYGTGRKGTAHQRELEAALKGDA